MAEKRFAAQEVIYRQGDKAETAYVVISGTVEIFRKGDGMDIKIGECSEGELFGETGILDANSPHTTSARAKSDVTVDTISFDELSEMVGQCPRRLIPVISSVFERLHSFTQRSTTLQQQVEAVVDADVEKIIIEGANEETRALIAPYEISSNRLPLRIGGYQKGTEIPRNHGNHVMIPSDGPPLTVSIQHCEVVAEEGKLFLRDNGSRFGTTVNGHIIGRGRGVYKSPLQKGENTIILGESKTSPYHLTLKIA